MGRYYIDRKLWTTNIYILDVLPKLQYKRFKTEGVEISDTELKKLILKEEANGREVNLWWKDHKKRRISDFQEFTERSRYNRVMNNNN